MEADWDVEIGKDASVIDACWAGLLDLRGAPHLAARLPESQQFPALADALVQLNSPGSPVWTSKCDVWVPSELDPDELEAQSEEATYAMACYIDLLPASDGAWTSAETIVGACRMLCERLRNVPLRCSRTDLVVRRAYVAPDRQDLGITAYLTSCGSTTDAALCTLGYALRALVHSVLLV